MVYDPSRTPVDELVLQSIETALRGITVVDGYSQDMRSVERWGPNAINRTGSFPCAVVLPFEETHDDSRIALLHTSKEIGISLGVDTKDWKTQLEKLLADVQVALFADHTRGGVAVTTKILAKGIQDSTGSGSRAAAHVYVQVLYRTLRDDPTTPK